MSTEVFYATVRRGDRTRLLLGPYDTHGEAADHLDEATRLACDYDLTCWFDTFGVTRIKPRTGVAPPIGAFNHRATGGAA